MLRLEEKKERKKKREGTRKREREREKRLVASSREISWRGTLRPFRVLFRRRKSFSLKL